MKKTIKVIDFIVTAGGYAAGFLCLVLVAVVVYGVFSRYILKAPLDWTMEVSQYVFCAISLLATGYALLKDSHVRIDLLRVRLSMKSTTSVWIYFNMQLLCVFVLYLSGWEDKSSGTHL